MIVKNIMQIIEQRGINRSRFYKETGLSNGFLDKVKSIGSSKIEKILKAYPDINPTWLLTGKGKMLLDDAGNNDDGKSSEGDEVQHDGDIPLISAVGIMTGISGNSFRMEHQHIIERYAIPLFKKRKVDFLIEIEGHSMTPKYNHGDIVACSIVREASFIQWNRVHLVITEQGILVKRLRKGANGVLMISENTNYDPFEVPKEKIMEIALVVGAVKLE